jgi:hypothetical protein
VSPVPPATTSAGQPLTGLPPAYYRTGATPYDVADTGYRPSTRDGTWSLIHAERAALAADLAELTEQLWATQ